MKLFCPKCQVRLTRTRGPPARGAASGRATLAASHGAEPVETLALARRLQKWDAKLLRSEMGLSRCPRAAQELYEHNVPNGNYIDGAFFGTTFPHLYLQTFSEMQPQKTPTTYVPRVFGFKVHK
eukprot:2747683-Prymnesium_polylepis.1